MICKNHESGKYQALAMYVSANKNQNLLKNLNLLCNYPPIPPVLREGREGIVWLKNLKGPVQRACVPCPGMSSVWMLVWEWGTSSASPSPDTLAPEEAPGTGLPVDACALRSTTAFRDWLLWFSIIRSRVISWHSKSRIKNLWILWIQSHLERSKLKVVTEDWKSKETFCLLSDCKINLCEQRDSSTK